MKNILKRIFAVILTLSLIAGTLFFTQAEGKNVEESVGENYIISPLNETPEEAKEEPNIGKTLLDKDSKNAKGDDKFYQYIDTFEYRYWLIKYHYHVYVDVAHSWYYMTGLRLTPIIYHAKGNAAYNLSYTIGQTYSSETASSFSTNVGLSAGNSNSVKASVAAGYGIERTIGHTYSVSSTVQATIDKMADTGYYQMQIIYNFYDVGILRTKTDDTTYMDEHTMGMPYGATYTSVLYSSTNTSGSWMKY